MIGDSGTLMPPAKNRPTSGMYKHFKIVEKWTTAYRNSLGGRDPKRNPRERNSSEITFEEVFAWGQRFSMLIRHPYGRRLFMRFLVTEHNEENLSFWEAVQVYKSFENPQKRLEFAQDIFKEFFSDDAKSEINIDASNRKIITSSIKAAEASQADSLNQSLFDGPLKHVYKLLEGDPWRRFKNSESFQRELMLRVTPEEVSTWKTDFDRLMSHPLGRKTFQEFLTQTWADENIHFWKEVRHFKGMNVNEEKLNKMAQAIWNRYLSRNSRREVNLDSETRHEIEASLDNPTTTLFERAEKHVYQLMQNDLFPRFVSSKLFHAFIQQREQLIEERQKVENEEDSYA